MKIHAILLSFLLIVTLLTGRPLMANGVLFLKEGSVKIVDPKRTRVYTLPGARVPLLRGYRVQTGKNTKVYIRILIKPEVIELLSRSFFRMGKITSETSNMALLTGKGRFKVGKSRLKRKLKTGSKRFHVRTVTALVGVKGTEFVVAATNVQTHLLTLSGTVSIAQVEMPDVEIYVPENRVSTVREQEPPTAPVEVTTELRREILSADSPEIFENVTFGKTVDPDEVRRLRKEEREIEEEEERKRKEEGTEDEVGLPEKREKKNPKDEEGQLREDQAEPKDEEEGLREDKELEPRSKEEMPGPELLFPELMKEGEDEILSELFPLKDEKEPGELGVFDVGSEELGEFGNEIEGFDGFDEDEDFDAPMPEEPGEL